ncbi:hypothetical protein [Actinomadura macra]|uniref:hypothetical protein n=1 Tax=Actinomadura macra TaxID=46164 RepID=UPI00083426A5|nr:hypothetical protein [Actinomadura macra]
MPLPNRARRTGTDRTIRASRMGLAGPLAITGVALIVFTVFWTTASPLIAVVMALAALAAGAILLVLVFGPGRLRGRTRSQGLWRYR